MSEILLAEDNPEMREMVADALRADGHIVREATNGAEAVAEMDRGLPDLVILDYRMGTPNGLEVCRLIKSDARSEHVPVLILTAEAAVEQRVEGFEAGADDYLAKPFDARELSGRVEALLRQARRGLERNPTTGLPGGAAIQREYERRHAAGTFALCYFDLNHFKPFGDRFGFPLGDAVIRDAGDSLRSAVRVHGGFVGHIGGDDFVVICDAEAARPVAEHARAGFRRRLLERLPEEVRDAGSYRGEDREGVVREFPLTDLAAALVYVASTVAGSLQEIGERVAGVKKRSKQDPSGIAELTLVE